MLEVPAGKEVPAVLTILERDYWGMNAYLSLFLLHCELDSFLGLV